MAFCFACFGKVGEQRREEERLASQDARAKAAEAAQKRQDQFEKSAAGRAARAQLAANAKQKVVSTKGEAVLKIFWKGSKMIYGSTCANCWLLFCLPTNDCEDLLFSYLSQMPRLAL